MTTPKQRSFWVELLTILVIVSSPITIMVFLAGALDHGLDKAFDIFADFIERLLS